MHNPYVGISNSAYDRAVRLASELGLTPVSRKRVVKAHRSVARIGAMKVPQAGLSSMAKRKKDRIRDWADSDRQRSGKRFVLSQS